MLEQKPVEYIVSFYDCIEALRAHLYEYIGTVAYCVELEEIIEYELTVLLLDQPRVPDITQDILLPFIVAKDKRIQCSQFITLEITRTVSNVIGTVKPEHHYQFESLSIEGEYKVTDKGDYRVQHYHQLLRERNERELQHGDYFTEEMLNAPY